VSTFHAADGAALFYEEHGPRGTIPLLFLHGWHADARVWQPIVAELGEDYHTISIDLRGFGRSSDAPGPYRVETFADDVSALIAELDLDPMVVVGHSMGAAIAQRLAVDRPDAVEALVLIAPVPANGVAFPARLDAMFRGTIGDEKSTAAWLSRLTATEMDAATTKVLRDAAAATPPYVALESYESWTTLSFADEVQTLATPTLVLAPELDKPMTPEYAREHVADLIEDCRFEIIPQTSHYAIVERPAEIAATICRFIEEL